MVPANLHPLKLLNVTLATVFGTTYGRLALDRTLIEGLTLSPVFRQTLQSSYELCQVGQFLQLFPYFWTERKIAKYKIAKNGQESVFFKDDRRVGKTGFSFDQTFHPLKALSQSLQAVAGAHTIVKIGCRFFYPSFSIGDGRKIQALAHGAKAFTYLDYLTHLQEDRSRSFEKGVIGLCSETLLACCHLSENRSLQLAAGIVDCLARGYLETRKEEKREAKNRWMEECHIELPNESFVEERHLLLKFIERLFGTTFFISSLLDTEQFARTLLCINGFAETYSAVFEVKKHPIFSYFGWAAAGMYGLSISKFLTFWSDTGVKKTATGLLFLLASGCDTLLFSREQQLIHLTKKVGVILIFKAVFTTLASFSLLVDLYKVPQGVENRRLESINAITKVPLTLNSATSYHGHPLEKKLVYLLGAVLGLNQIARGLCWESLKKRKTDEIEKKLAKGWNNQVQDLTSSSDTNPLARQTYL